MCMQLTHTLWPCSARSKMCHFHFTMDLLSPTGKLRTSDHFFDLMVQHSILTSAQELSKSCFLNGLYFSSINSMALISNLRRQCFDSLPGSRCILQTVSFLQLISSAIEEGLLDYTVQVTGMLALESRPATEPFPISNPTANLVVFCVTQYMSQTGFRCGMNCQQSLMRPMNICASIFVGEIQNTPICLLL